MLQAPTTCIHLGFIIYSELYFARTNSAGLKCKQNQLNMRQSENILQMATNICNCSY
uniref:Uncharacterized protein n=1 Tax=Arundo donax TaxID=35708 RepID=A0A0A8ZQZ4_ARUDO